MPVGHRCCSTPPRSKPSAFWTASSTRTGSSRCATRSTTSCASPSSYSSPSRIRSAPKSAPALRVLLALLHWVAGVSYFKLAAPPRVEFEGEPPAGRGGGAARGAVLGGPRGVRLHQPPRAASPAALLAGRTTDSPARPLARRRSTPAPAARAGAGGRRQGLGRGDRDRPPLRSRERALFSIGDAPPIARTVAAAGLPWLMARRQLDPQLRRLNESGALNGHVPVTAIVTATALLCACLNGYRRGRDGQRALRLGGQSPLGRASRSTTSSARACAWSGCSSDALQELDAPVRAFSVLRPASELAIARAFARLDSYHARVHELQHDLPPGPGAAGRLVVLRVPQVQVRVPRARALQRARAPARDLRARPARRGAPVRGLRAAVRGRRAQAVRVRRRGAGEPRRDPAAGRGRALERAPGPAQADRRGAPPARAATRETRTGCSS